MYTLRTALIASTFSALSLLAAACGDDTSGTGGGSGAGGSGTGGDASTTTTTTTTTGGSGSICEEAADVSDAKATELGCTASNRAEFIQECETDLVDAGDCADEYTAFLECLITLPSSSWSCDPADNGLVVAEGSCPAEVDALVTCSGF